MTLDDVKRDIECATDALRCEVKQGRYETARQTAEMIVSLSRAAERMAYENVREMTLKEVYGF